MLDLSCVAWKGLKEGGVKDRVIVAAMCTLKIWCRISPAINILTTAAFKDVL
jgi:hypothetical protein